MNVRREWARSFRKLRRTVTDAETGERLPEWWELPQHPLISIELFVGPPGDGKSLQLVHRALELMASGWRVWANFDLVHRPLGLRAGYCGSWRAFEELYALDRCQDKCLVIQEVNACAPSRDWTRLPTETRNHWAQIRHRGIRLLMDAQHEKRVDTVMREILTDIVICRGTPAKYKHGYPAYVQTWCEPLLAERARVYMALTAAGVVEAESDAVPPGDIRRVVIPGWVHTCYDTHAEIQPWLYDDDREQVPLTPPERLQGGLWVPM